MIRKLRLRVVRRWLAEMNAFATDRIDGGDFDFDDVLYRTRDATAELLDLFGEVQR
jgi:hypothetical protein